MNRCKLIVLAILIIVIVSGSIYGYRKSQEPQTIESGRISEVVKLEENIDSAQIVKHSTGASIELAAGSLNSDVQIEIVEIENTNGASTPAYGSMYDIKVEGSEITKPALVSVPLPAQANSQEDWVVIHQVNGNWEYLPSIVDNGTVQAQTTSFSIFGAGKAKQAILVDQAGEKQGIWLAYTKEAGKDYIFFKEYETSEDLDWDDIKDGSKIYFADPDSEMVNWWEFTLDAVTHYGIPLETFLKTVIKYEFKLLEDIFEYIYDQTRVKTAEEDWEDIAMIARDSGDTSLILEVGQYRLLPSSSFQSVDPQLVIDPTLSNAEKVDDCELFFLIFHNTQCIGGYRQRVKNMGTQDVTFARHLYGDAMRTDPLQIIVVLVGKETGSSWFSFKKKQVLAVFSNLPSEPESEPAFTSQIEYRFGVFTGDGPDDPAPHGSGQSYRPDMFTAATTVDDLGYEYYGIQIVIENKSEGKGEELEINLNSKYDIRKVEVFPPYNNVNPTLYGNRVIEILIPEIEPGTSVVIYIEVNSEYGIGTMTTMSEDGIWAPAKPAILLGYNELDEIFDSISILFGNGEEAINTTEPGYIPEYRGSAGGGEV